MDCVVYKQQKPISPSSGGTSPWSKCQQIQCLGKASFLVQRRLSSPKDMTEGMSSSIWALIPFMNSLPSWWKQLPKASTPNAITLEIKFQHINWGWCTNIQSWDNQKWFQKFPKHSLERSTTHHENHVLGSSEWVILPMPEAAMPCIGLVPQMAGFSHSADDQWSYS